MKFLFTHLVKVRVVGRGFYSWCELTKVYILKIRRGGEDSDRIFASKTSHFMC